MLQLGAHFSKNLIHVSRKISHFSLHISIIEKCIISLHISHITFHVSHFKSLIYIHILHFTLYILLCEVWSVKWEMWNKNHKTQFPDAKCDLWNKRETWNQFLKKCAPGQQRKMRKSQSQNFFALTLSQFVMAFSGTVQFSSHAAKCKSEWLPGRHPVSPFQMVFGGPGGQRVMSQQDLN